MPHSFGERGRDCLTFEPSLGTYECWEATFRLVPRSLRSHDDGDARGAGKRPWSRFSRWKGPMGGGRYRTRNTRSLVPQCGSSWRWSNQFSRAARKSTSRGAMIHERRKWCGPDSQSAGAAQGWRESEQSELCQDGTHAGKRARAPSRGWLEARQESSNPRGPSPWPPEPRTRPGCKHPRTWDFPMRRQSTSGLPFAPPWRCPSARGRCRRGSGLPDRRWRARSSPWPAELRARRDAGRSRSAWRRGEEESTTCRCLYVMWPASHRALSAISLMHKLARQLGIRKSWRHPWQNRTVLVDRGKVNRKGIASIPFRIVYLMRRSCFANQLESRAEKIALYFIRQALAEAGPWTLRTRSRARRRGDRRQMEGRALQPGLVDQGEEPDCSQGKDRYQLFERRSLG